MDSVGNFMVVWVDFRNIHADIYGQRFNNVGAPIGMDFKVNEAPLRNTTNDVAIAMNGSGSFVVVWEAGGSRAASEISGQLYAANGARLGNNFRVNDDPGSNVQYNPAVAINDSGKFVVVWVDNRNSKWDIYGQRYDAEGRPQDGNFEVTEDTSNTYGESYCAVAIDGNGNFVVVWTNQRNEDLKTGIHGRRYDASALPQENSFIVNDDANGTGHSGPAIAMDDSGNFVAVWQDSRNVNSDIYRQLYDSGGMPQGSNLRVNFDEGSTSQFAPGIAVDDSGNFVVVWEDHRNDIDIYAQPFAKNGRKVGANYRVNNDSEGKFQGVPDVKLVNKRIYYTWHDTRIEG